MKKIVFLGCENSHSAMFLGFIQADEKYKDIEVLGVYSHDIEASKKLSEKYNVPVLANYDDAVGQADGVVITARNGDNHYKYAKPYIQKGVTMFIDKPITIDESESLEFMWACKETGVKITGGSCLRFDAWVQEIAEGNAKNEGGDTLGGYVRCPISLVNPNGGFFFYAQHLVETVQVAFGRNIKSVYAKKSGKTLQVLFHYETFSVCGTFVDESYKSYYLARLTENEVKGKEFTVDAKNGCFKAEWDEFYTILSGKEQVATYRDFVAPVFVMNTISRSISSGKEEPVKEYEV